MESSLVLRELGTSAADLALLRGFYDDLYCREFPEADERESFENMVMYLGGAGSNPNGYHIVLALRADQVIGGSVSDYFAVSHSGVIEFVVIAPAARGRGWGTALLRKTEGLLAADAEHVGAKLQFVMAEINDPWLSVATHDTLDPFERARWWGRRGYGRLAFPYVQPPLSSAQAAVEHLMLCTKLVAHPRETSLPSASVLAFVRDYLMFAMRFNEPDVSADFVHMRSWLNEHALVTIEPLAAYVATNRAARPAQ